MIVAVFLGRIHHFLKLRPIINGLIEANHDVQVLITDNSVNIDPATEYIHRLGISSFNHAHDYIAIDDIDTINAMSKELMHFATHEQLTRHIPPFWIASSIRDAAKDLAGFNRYLGLGEVDAVFALHEQNFFVKSLFYIARKNGIKTFSLQEGIILAREEDILKRYTTATAHTDRLFSWSEYDRAFYTDPDKIIPVGPSHLDEWIMSRNNAQEYFAHKTQFKQGLGLDARDPVIAFMPPRLDLYKGDFGNDLSSLAEWTRDRGINLVIKLHPFQAAEVLRKINDDFIDKYVHVKLYTVADGLPCIAGADAVITQTSTVELEAIALGIPVIEIDTEYNGLEQPLWKHGAATLLEKDEFDKITDVLQGRFDIDALNKFRNDRLRLADGMATKRIINYVGA
ncbi:MAG: UDP-N-acetylglucosamine 2-epimerase [Planctomycetota bacterium]|jgi:hypothetical protein